MSIPSKDKFTPAEKELWKHLRNSKLGFKFYKQYKIKGFKYLLDFYCTEKLLAIELDGNVHNIPKTRAKDKRRERELSELGIKTLRFENKMVFEDIQIVLEEIKKEL